MKRQLVFLAFFGLLPLATTAQAEFVLDMSFGTHGIVISPLATYAGTIATQLDGKIIATERRHAEPLFLSRRLADGSIDTSFGENGKAEIPVAENYLSLTVPTILIRPNQKIIACVEYNQPGTADTPVSKTLLIQYNPNGTVDRNFHTNVVRGMGKAQYALQSDGKIVAARISSDQTTIILVRRNEDGSIDRSFGRHGIRKFRVPTNSTICACAIQTNGKVIILTNDNSSHFSLCRYNDDGSPDATFGTQTGATSFTIPDGQEFENLCLQPSNQIVVSYRGTPGIRHVYCYTSEGLPNTEWSPNGTTIITIPLHHIYTSSIILQPNGDVMVDGVDSFFSENPRAFFARYRKPTAAEEAAREAQQAIIRGERELRKWWDRLLTIGEADEICPICHEAACMGDVIHTECGHLFHADCLNTWENQGGDNSARCPLCRESLAQRGAQ